MPKASSPSSSFRSKPSPRQGHRQRFGRAHAAAEPGVVSRPLRGRGVGKFHQYRGAFLLATAALLCWVLLPFLLPISVGAIFAVVLTPAMDKLERRIASRAGRAGLITGGFLIAFLLPIGVMAVLGTEAALSKFHELSAGGGGIQNFSPTELLRQFGFESFLKTPPSWLPASEAQIRGYLIKAVEAAGIAGSRLVQGFIADLPQLLFSNVVVMLAMFTFLADGPRVARFFRRNSFFSEPATDSIIANVAAVCQSTVVASLATGLVQAGLVAIACFVTSTSNALLVALASFFFSFLPVVGTAPLTISLGLAAFARGDATTAIVFFATIVVVGIADNFVRPLVIQSGGRGGGQMHPLVAFISAFGGLEAMGFYGLFAGPVIAGLFFSALPVVMHTYGRTLAFPQRER